MISAKTALYQAKVWVLALVHPATVVHLLAAFLRGLGVVLVGLHHYVKGLDKLNLMATNPLAHHKETEYRRWVVMLGVFLDLVLAVGFHMGRTDVWPWVALHFAVLVWIGRRDPIVQPIYAKGLGREGMIIRIVDEITLTAALRKADAHTMIISPPARLAHTSGYEVTVRVHPEGEPERLINGAARLAHKHRKDARQVYVYRVQGTDLVRIVVLDADPWLKPITTPSFVTRPRQMNLWRDLVDQGTMPDGTRWSRRLVEAGDGGGQVIGGAPRQGKTVYLRGLVCAVLLDPFANLRMIDGKAIDFEPARPLCASYVGETNMDDRKLLAQVIVLLEQMVAEVKRRRDVLKHLDVDHLSEELARDHGMPTEWIMVDEIAVFTEDMRSTHKAAVDKFLELLGWLVRMGPTVGVFCVLATQRPSELSLPPGIKGMILIRIALRVGDQPASMAIMSRAGEAHRADLLPVGQEYKGVAIVRDVGQLRIDMVTRDDLKRVVVFAASVRGPIQDRPGDYPPLIAACLDAIGTEDRISTEKLIQELGAGDTPESLAARLKPYGLAPRNVRFPDGSVLKGYYRDEIRSVPKLATDAQDEV